MQARLRKYIKFQNCNMIKYALHHINKRFKLKVSVELKNSKTNSYLEVSGCSEQKNWGFGGIMKLPRNNNYVMPLCPANLVFDFNKLEIFPFTHIKITHLIFELLNFVTFCSLYAPSFIKTIVFCYRNL